MTTAHSYGSLSHRYILFVVIHSLNGEHSVFWGTVGSVFLETNSRCFKSSLFSNHLSKAGTWLVWGAVWSSSNSHLRPSHCDPLVLGAIEPREPEVIAPIQVGVLAVGEPPATLIVCGTVCVADVAVRVNGAELHPVLILQSVARVALVPGYVQAVAIPGIRDSKLFVFCNPALAIYVREIHS